MVWNKTCGSEKKVWGDKPGELAIYACNYLQQSRQFQGNPDMFILDLGCGYGHDAIFLAQNIPCHILGLDSAQKAIEIARNSLPKDMEKRIEFLCYDFNRVSDKYDVILASNIYHLLKPGERVKLRNTIKRCLKENGVLFLSSLSIHDSRHLGKGTPVEDEADTFEDETYLHLSTREELEADFDFLYINALFEREFQECRSTKDRRHVTWILMGKLK